jgi:hypothetical protein
MIVGREAPSRLSPVEIRSIVFLNNLSGVWSIMPIALPTLPSMIWSGISVWRPVAAAVCAVCDSVLQVAELALSQNGGATRCNLLQALTDAEVRSDDRRHRYANPARPPKRRDRPARSRRQEKEATQSVITPVVRLPNEIKPDDTVRHAATPGYISRRALVGMATRRHDGRSYGGKTDSPVKWRNAADGGSRRCMLISVALAQLTSPPDVKKDIAIVARCMEAGTLVMSAGLNALAFTGGAFDAAHWAQVAFGCFVPAAISGATHILARLTRALIAHFRAGSLPALFLRGSKNAKAIASYRNCRLQRDNRTGQRRCHIRLDCARCAGDPGLAQA